MTAAGRHSTKWRSLTVCAFVLASAVAPRAHAEADVQLWFELDVDKQLSRTWSVAFEQHLRFDEDVSRVAQIMPDVSITARLARWARAIVGYRLQYVRNGAGELVVRHRPYAGGTVRTDVLSDLRLSARLLFTEQIRGLATEDLRHGFRAKATAAWRGYRRAKPEISSEFFFAIADPSGVELDKIRLGVDLSTPVGAGDVGIGYRVEVAQRDASDPVVHAVLMNYAFEL